MGQRLAMTRIFLMLSPSKHEEATRSQRESPNQLSNEGKMVDATGIEPVTPSMSTRCSPAELRVRPGSGEEREAGIYRPGALKASGSGEEM